MASLCPKSKRGHSWGGRDAIIDASPNDPEQRTCRECGAIGRVDEQGRTVELRVPRDESGRYVPATQADWDEIWRVIGIPPQAIYVIGDSSSSLADMPPGWTRKAAK